MTNSTSTQRSSQPRRSSALRRTIAGVVAAASVALGGATMVSAEDATAAGVQTTTYAHVYAVPTAAVTVVDAPSRTSNRDQD